MACSCKKRTAVQYVWTSDDGKTQIIYPSLIQAKAKVHRRGGSYAPKEG